MNLLWICLNHVIFGYTMVNVKIILSVIFYVFGDWKKVDKISDWKFPVFRDFIEYLGI